MQAFQIANLIREYSEVLNATAAEEAKEQMLQNGIMPQQQIIAPNMNHMQMANQMKLHQMQNAARMVNGNQPLPPQLTPQQQQAHFRHAAQTTLVPPQPS